MVAPARRISGTLSRQSTDRPSDDCRQLPVRSHPAPDPPLRLVPSLRKKGLHVSLGAPVIDVVR